MLNVSDVLPLVKDFARNQNLDSSRALRAIDSAVSFVTTHMGVPGYDRTATIAFDSEEPTYSVPAGFAEAFFVRYEDDYLNRGSRFTGKAGEFLFEKISSHDRGARLFGQYYDNGTARLIIIGQNSKPHLLIDSFDADNASSWEASNDAANVRDGNPLDATSTASLQFDIDTSLSGSDRATLTRTLSAPQDLSVYENRGIFKVKAYLPTVTELSSVSLSWGTSASAYRKVTVTAQADGSALVAGANSLAFAWEDGTTVGSPDMSAVTMFWFDIDYTGSFTSAEGFMLDTFRCAYPDNVLVSYYTSYHGQDAGGTSIASVTATTDKLLCGSEFTLPIAAYAAVIINPQLLIDDAYVRGLYKDATAILPRRYPRRRAYSASSDPKVSKTTS